MRCSQKTTREVIFEHGVEATARRRRFSYLRVTNIS
jgi:hypothetical protein